MLITAGSSDIYDGRVLASAHDVVIVTINYRMGIFGKYTVNALQNPGGGNWKQLRQNWFIQFH